MLTIGQLARLAGTTVRAVRHYHQSGILPEPLRGYNGYRQYRASDLNRLLQIRQLSELGLGLTEVRRLIAATPDERRDALRTLDTQFAAEQDLLAERRSRLAELLATQGDPTMPSPYREQAADLREMGAPAELIDLDSALFRMVMTVMPEADRAVVDAALTELAADPATVRFTADFMRRLAEVSDLPVDHPTATALADDYVTYLRMAWPKLLVPSDDQPANPLADWTVNDFMREHLTPTQIAVIRRALRSLGPGAPDPATGAEPQVSPGLGTGC